MICSGGDRTDEGREDSQTMLLHCSSDGLSGSFPTMMGDDGLSADGQMLPLRKTSHITDKVEQGREKD